MEVIYKNAGFSFLFSYNCDFEQLSTWTVFVLKQRSVELSLINHSFTDLQKSISMMQMREVIFQSTINISF